MEWLTAEKLPIGKYSKSAIEWLTDNFDWFFDGMSDAIKATVAGIEWCLLTPHPLIVVGIFAAASFLVRRSLWFTLFVIASLLLIINIGYWEQTAETLAMVTAATVTCMAIGIPIGIAAARKPWLMSLLRPVLDLMQTLPTFVYLIPTLVLFGLGVAPGLVSTVIFALPASIRLTELGIAATPKALLEAGDAFGASSWQRLMKVELPYAMPQIRAGLTQTIMLSLSMVVIAALVGADGLGKPVVRALNTANIGMGFEAGLSIVLIAIILDRFFRTGDGKA